MTNNLGRFPQPRVGGGVLRTRRFADERVIVSERIYQPDDQNDFPHPGFQFIAMETVLPAQSGGYSALRFLGDVQYHLTAGVMGLSLFVRFGGVGERQHLRDNRLDFLLLD